MIELVVATTDADKLREDLLVGEIEACAVLFANQVKRSDGTIRLLVREIIFPEPDDYLKQERAEAELNPCFVAKVTKQALRTGSSLVFVHSHVGTAPPFFSRVDDLGEELLSRFLNFRHPSATHLAAVISRGGMRARKLGTYEEARVVALGTHREVLFDPDILVSPSLEVFDRQVRAFGTAGQEKLQRVRVAIVGLGGTGSLVAQQLAHLGVREFILVDPDVIDVTNLNRVADATISDIGNPKVVVAERHIFRISPHSKVNCIKGSVIQAQVAHELSEADVIFGCTDSHGSRAILQQIAYQYLIPCIDVGTTIIAVKGNIEHVYGRVQLLSPGYACFTCNDLLDSNEVRRDMMNSYERQADPYINGAREPAPAVMSLNGTVVSLGVTMFLSMIAGIPADGRHLLYNAIASTLRKVRAAPNPSCFVCSRDGAFARGDSWPLFARQD